MAPVVAAQMLPSLEKTLGINRSELRKKGTDLGLYLQPLTDIHLYSDLKPVTELEPGSDVRYIYLFGAIALFMLLLACINFMNLSTAGASKRAKEVGVRKVLGSARSKLMGQFLSESVLFTLLSLLLSLGLVVIALPLFNSFSGKTLALNLLRTPHILLGVIGFGLVVSLIAGSYPAFYLSSFRPIAVLKGLRVSAERGGLRSGLVVFQFLVSVSLIIATTVVYRQLSYIQNMKLGYDKDQVLIVEGTFALGNNETVFRRQLTQDSRIVNASVSGFLPNEGYYTGMVAMQPDRIDAQMTRMVYFGVDDQYIPTLGMKMVAGRNFSASFPSDSNGAIINETAARLFGWRNPVGHTLTNPALPQNGNKAHTFQVIGVVKDFHYRSLHEQIAPMVMQLGGNSGSVIVKTKAKDMEGLLATLKEQWEAFKTGEPFRYSFLGESYTAMHQTELRTGRIMGIFAGLTIFVACLGLFGLATFIAEQRTKEIGVRKVLGASVASIVTLLATDFLKPVLIAIVFASPIAWYAMDKWLQSFAYKIDIQWWIFVLAGLLATIIALLTVSFQSVKAALMNPVKSLRSE
jgi:putative ABC transport system permease protein